MTRLREQFFFSYTYNAIFLIFVIPATRLRTFATSITRLSNFSIPATRLRKFAIPVTRLLKFSIPVMQMRKIAIRVTWLRTFSVPVTFRFLSRDFAQVFDSCHAIACFCDSYNLMAYLFDSCSARDCVKLRSLSRVNLRLLYNNAIA